MDISVVTINYKEARLTIQCVKKLLKSKKVRVEVIVIDNSCDEKEAKYLKKLTDKRVHLYIMSENLGVAQGYSLGAKQAKGKYIFILNNDAEIDNDLGLFRMKKYLDLHPDVAVIQPKIKSYHDHATFDYAGGGGGYIDIYGYPFCRGRLFQTLEEDHGQYDDIVDITWASTCAFFSRSDVLIKAGLFDPIYFAYAEEVDTSMKIWGMGYKIRAFPSTSVFHHGGRSWNKRKPQKTFLIHRNHFILFFKRFSLKDIIILTPVRIFFELLSVGFYIITDNVYLVPSILGAYASVISLMPQIIRGRINNVFFYGIFERFDKTSMPIYKHSIILSHYLFRKRKFSDLNPQQLYGQHS